jgi:hypothetical protein
VLDDTHTHADADVACDANAPCSTCKSVNHLYQQVIPICNPADPITTIEQIAFFHQGRATNRQLAAPSQSDKGAARFKFLHLCFGGAITAHNVGDFIEVYPGPGVCHHRKIAEGSHASKHHQAAPSLPLLHT